MFDGFLHFQISEKWANLRFPLNIQKQKSVSASGPRWGLRPQTPVIGSRSARSPCPPLLNPKYVTGYSAVDGLYVCPSVWQYVAGTVNCAGMCIGAAWCRRTNNTSLFITPSASSADIDHTLPLPRPLSAPPHHPLPSLPPPFHLPVLPHPHTTTTTTTCAISSSCHGNSFVDQGPPLGATLYTYPCAHLWGSLPFDQPQ